MTGRFIKEKNHIIIMGPVGAGKTHLSQARLHSYEITFLRFLFGTVTLLPFIMYYGASTLKKN